jgi:opacity protein-like surface antigen
MTAVSRLGYPLFMFSSPILCLPLVLPAADSIEDLYARFGAGYSTSSPADFTLTGANESVLIRQILQTFEPSLEFDGWNFQFALGEKLTENIAFEWEVQSLQLDLDSFTSTATDNGGGLFPFDPNDGTVPGFFRLDGASGEFKALALTANLHFDYQFGESGFGVYGGVGAGFSRNTLNLTVSETFFETEGSPAGDSIDATVPLATDDTWDFCWHWRAGVEYEINRKSTLYVGWRAADYGSADLQGSGPALTADTIEFGFKQSF